MPTVCSHCRYPLDGESPPGTPHPRCPECGLDPGDIVPWPPGVLRPCVPYLAWSFERLGRLARIVPWLQLGVLALIVPRIGVLGSVLLGACVTGWLIISGQQWSRALRAMRDWTGTPGWLGIDAEYHLLFHLPTLGYLMAMACFILYGLGPSWADSLLVAGWVGGVVVSVLGVVAQRRISVGAVGRVLLAAPDEQVRALAPQVRPSSVILESCGAFMTLIALPLIDAQRHVQSGVVSGLGPIALLAWCGVTTDWRGIRAIAPALSAALRRASASLRG